MKKLFLSLILMSVTILAQTDPLTVDDLWGMERINGFELSPDGKKLAYVSAVYSMELNKGNSNIYIADSDGKNLTPFRMTEKNESGIKFSPDGKKVAYIFEDQIWISNTDGSDAVKVTDMYTGASGIVWSPDGKKLLFISSVYPDCFDQDCNKRKDEKKEKDPVKASIFTELMYRHWNDWRGDKRSHLFILDVDKKEVIDLTMGSSADVPPIALGSATDYTFSPDGQEIAFVMNTDKVPAISTNNDIFITKTADISKDAPTKFTRVSVSKGVDCNPQYSPDGKFLAWASMERAGFEADRKRLMVMERATGKITDHTTGFELSVDEILWAEDSKSIYFTAEQEIHKTVFNVKAGGGEISPVIKGHNLDNLAIANGRFYFRKQATNLPFEIFTTDMKGGDAKQLTFVNKKKLDRILMNPVETFWSKGADGTPVQSVMIKPPHFDPKQKYPMIFLIHGGPQGAWSDDFHYRWNVQLFASGGYVVVAPNPRGSTGYGQKFTDEISGDWGGKVYTDLMNAYDYAIRNYAFIDSNNTFAAGASYGGYMINWIAGHTDRFNALVSHAGVFNLESMYGTTEELWFPEWENKGTPWENRGLYEKFSPHRYIQNCKTPVLVVHGAYDFRVPEEQAFQLFTSLQRLGVDSKFLYFPDETHFVSKPQNAKLWWQTVFGWFERYYKTGK